MFHSVNQSLATPSMSSPHSHTLAVQLSNDDDDTDICPVCDGQCTCNTTTVTNTTILTHNKPSLPPFTSSQDTKLPSLKIKLTVPPNLFSKRRSVHPNSKSSSISEHTDSFTLTDTDVTPSPFSPDYPLTPHASTSYLPNPVTATITPKKRGRPPKSVIVPRDTKKQARVPPPSSSPLPSRRKQKKSSASEITQKLKGKASTVKKPLVPVKRRRVASSDESSDQCYDPDDEDDAESIQFPTFVSASALSSLSSDDDPDSPFDFDSDSSMEAEEEKFIINQVHDKVRLRRELLGDDSQIKRDGQHNNDWVIRSRKKSVGPSDAEMDVDSDATEDEDDEDDQEEDEDGEDDGEETDGRSTGAGYVGFATGWSEDDESSFDADLFFANLSDSEDNSSSSSSDAGIPDEGDQSDVSFTDGTPSPHVRPDTENLPLEVTEGWDGQIVFTNGLTEGQGMVDLDFASQFIAESGSSSPSQDNSDSDIDMAAMEDDLGYEEDLDGGEGETTDEELVGEDYLPNERAMRLFNLPSSVSAINPLSTVSPVLQSRIAFQNRSRNYRGGLDSPMPLDILSGKIFWDSDEIDELGINNNPRPNQLHGRTGHLRSLSETTSSRDSGPRTGVFFAVQETRQAIIDDSHKEVPSPHPRFNRVRGRGSSSYTSSSTRHIAVEHILRQHLISSIHHNDFAVPSTPSEDIIQSSPGLPPTDAIDLDDVLEASLLDTNPLDHVYSSSTDSTVAAVINGAGDEETVSGKSIKNLNRWDLISVGAFRQSQTRDPGSVTTEANVRGGRAGSISGASSLGNIMKSSPLSTLLWPHKHGNGGSNGNNKRKKRRSAPIISPVILPLQNPPAVCQTPPSHTQTHQPPPLFNQNHNKYTNKNRKEQRRERKIRRKNNTQQPQQPRQYHHSHHHHPNSKSRSSGSVQRMNFFSSSVPPLSL